MAKMSGNVEHLRKYGAAPVARWLVKAAISNGTMTYGQAKAGLETKHGFSTIFPIRIGNAAGELMDRFHESNPSLPLINVLLVGKSSDEPGNGINPYMKARYPELKKKLRSRYPDLWRRKFAEAREEVYAYKDWVSAYESAFGRWQGPKPKPEPAEKDGHKFGGGGEGPYHKALRLWVKKNPKKVQENMKMRDEPKTEAPLLSGDKVDVVYYGQKKTVAIEVKSKKSNRQDLERGVYQCVKYRAVLEAHPDNAGYRTDALLVTEEPLPGDLACLARKLKIKHAVHRVNK